MKMPTITIATLNMYWNFINEPPTEDFPPDMKHKLDWLRATFVEEGILDVFEKASILQKCANPPV
jgi:hypothetical protein